MPEGNQDSKYNVQINQAGVVVVGDYATYLGGCLLPTSPQSQRNVVE